MQSVLRKSVGGEMGDHAVYEKELGFSPKKFACCRFVVKLCLYHFLCYKYMIPVWPQAIRRCSSALPARAAAAGLHQQLHDPNQRGSTRACPRPAGDRTHQGQHERQGH